MRETRVLAETLQPSHCPTLPHHLLRASDVIVFATGYDYDFSFLSQACGIVIEPQKVVSPVYQHLINIEHPTMALLGLPWTVRLTSRLDEPHDASSLLFSI